MGNQSFVFVVLAAILASMTIITFSGIWNSSTLMASSELEVQQAINVSNSGVNQAITRLRRSRSWRTGFTDLSIANGRCTATLTTVGADSVRIVSTGTFGAASHTSNVLVKLASIFPTVESALTIYGDSVHFSNSGKAFLIDGRDHNSDGSLGTHTPVNGMGVTTAHTDSSLSRQLTANGVESNVLGKGGAPSVGTYTPNSLIELRNMYRDIATMRLASGSYSGNAIFGTMTQPVILYVPGNLDWNGTITGSGILVVDGTIRMSGKIAWYGIVIAVSGSIELNLGGSGNPSIIGTCLVGNSAGNITHINVNGTPNLLYSYTVLETVLNNLDLLSVEIVKWWE